MGKTEQLEEQDIERALQHERILAPSQFIIEQTFLPYDDQGNYLERE